MASNKLKQTASAAFLLLMFFYVPQSSSEEWVPDNPSAVILEYDVASVTVQGESLSKKSSADLLQTTAQLIQDSRFPGNSHKLLKAKSILLDITKDSLNLRQQNHYYLAQANIAQGEHQFDESLRLLEKIDQGSVYYPQSRLIAARIYMIQNKLASAEKQCRHLITHNLAASELCLIEVNVHRQKMELVKPSIKRLSKRYSSQSTPLAHYFYQITGTMHRLKQDYQKAQDSFSVNLNQAPVSQWYRWSDMAFEADAYQEVYDKLRQLEQRNRFLEDGLLVRLARAEKLTGARTQYQQLAAQKIQLRQLRQDKLHAADIAYYYLYVVPNATLALRWAQQNWEQVKEPADKVLLQRAQKLTH